MVSERSQTQGQTQYDSTGMRCLELSDPRQRKEDGEGAQAGKGELVSNGAEFPLGKMDCPGDGRTPT